MDNFQTERLTQEKWLNLFVRTYRHRDKEGRWVFVSRHHDPSVPAEGIDAVVIVPLLVSDAAPPRLVVTREFRVPLGAYEYGFPAGLVEPGESVEKAARRELKEETGLEVIEVVKVSPPTYSSAGMTDEAVAIAFVTALAPADCQPALEDTEDITVLLLDYPQVCALCDSRERINGRAWPIFYMFQRLGALA